ncbi:hypothetical protein FNV43_RR19604 [Rhamnella rubrinervis]|uniref:DUF1985 domain-containing protein n=1 Tax=Rhamnella rubrinervis TaxID=2594499 RepID=A0A8K0DUD3_9ROSA|nr:hypothetical protein FNV43_RR19604 [Rhamnella rubrinervis]
MVFNFGGSGARFTIQEFCLISGLFCGLVPSTRPTTYERFRDTYFSGREFPLHNHDIVDVFSTVTCEDDNDMVKLALLYFLDTVILSKEKPMTIHVERVDMLYDIEYFLTYLWDTLSYDATVKSMRGCPGKRNNTSHTYSITSFPIAFMVWGYETIPSLAEAFGIKSSLPICPRMRNWTISEMPKKKILEDIFVGQGFEVVRVMVSRVYEIPLIATVHNVEGRKPYDAAPVVKDKPDVDLDTNRVHSVADKDKTGTKKNDAVKRGRRHSSPFAYTPAASAHQSSPIASPIDAATPDAYHRHSSPAPHTSTELDEDDDQCFDEVGGKDVGVESKHSMKVFTQMSDRKLAGGRRKRRATKTIESSYDCQSLRRKMICTLPTSGSVTFDPYRPVSDEHIETVAQLIRQRVDKYPEVFDDRILLLDNRLSVLSPLNRDNNYCLLGDINLCAQHMTLYDCKKYGQTDQLYQVNQYRRLMPMLPYLLRATCFFAFHADISNSMNEFEISLAPDCPQQKIE